MPAAQTTTPARNPGVDRLLSILQRRAWLMAVPAVLAITLTVSIVVFLPDLYRSSATILVERPQVPEDFVRSTITREVDSRLQEISQQIMSRSRLVSLIDKYGLYADLRKRRHIEEVVQRMRGDIQLELKGARRDNARDATVAFTISYVGTDPQAVAAVANELATTYIEEDVKVRKRQAAGTAEFLRGELDGMKGQLESQEQAVKDFKERHMGELPQQETANLSTLERLSAQLLLNSERQALSRARLTIFERQLSEPGNTGSPSSDSVPVRLERARRELADLRKRFTEKYPEVIRLRAEIAALERQQAGDVGRPADTNTSVTQPLDALTDVMPTAQAELKVLKAEEVRLRRLIAEYEERIENTPRREQEFGALRRDYETTQQVYQSLLKRYEEAKLAESLERNEKGEQFRILEPALIAERPVAPNRLRLLLIGLFLSFGLAAVVAAIAETVDSSIHGADELRAVSNVPILASIPRIVTDPDRRDEARRLWLGATSTAVGLAAIAAATYLFASRNAWLATLFS